MDAPRAAKATHWAFYALMVAIPPLRLLYVSTEWRGSAPLNIPTLWFGLSVTRECGEASRTHLRVDFIAFMESV